MQADAAETRTYVAWPDAAREAVERAIERHGEREAWDAFHGLRVGVMSFSGKVGELKGVGRTFRLPVAFEVYPKATRTVFPDFPEPTRRVVYEAGDLFVEGDGRGGPAAEEHRGYRRTFSGLAKLRKWSDLDIAYFVGYSQSNYHGYPFTLPALRFVRAASYRSDGGRWTRLTLDYPVGSECHSRRQTFHFDATGLLRRVDYRAEIVGPGPSACHLYEEYREVAGLLFPARRRVLARVLGWRLGTNLLTADFDLVAIDSEGPQT